MSVRYQDLPASTRAEYRAVEHGSRVRVESDGSLSVLSDSEPGIRRRVTFRALVSGTIWFECDCPGGEYRRGRGPVVCWHQARAARFLEHSGRARWTKDATWVVAGDLRRAWEQAELDALDAGPEDPFAGLPGR